MVPGLRTLLLDNHDSFTYNLHALLSQVNGREPEVVCNDAASWPQLDALQFDNIVISPGPGRPENPDDFGVCAGAIGAFQGPVLGVCLGHQGICVAHGAAIVHAPEPVHGRCGVVSHDGSALFARIPRRFSAVRYHSLCVAQPLPAELVATAFADDGVLMAVAHRTRPHFGVQFHPESICTEHGRRLLANFRDVTLAHHAAHPGHAATTRGSAGLRRGSRIAPPPRPWGPPASSPATGPAQGPARRLTVTARCVHGAPDPERAFVALYGQSETAFWLDSAVVEGRSRFSFIGSAEGPLAATVAYDVNRGEVAVQTERGAEVRSETIFEYLAGEVGRLDVNCEALPFDFNGGWVGYFGYECKADCGGDNAHAASTPDAAFVFADRLIAFDLLTRCAYIVSVTAAGDETAGAAWIAETARRLGALAPPPRIGAAADRYLGETLALRRPRAEYLNDIAAVAERLADGDSYEVCLTNEIAGPLDCDPLVLYRRLRQVNPAPHCAFLRFGTTAVLSSSPERFLRIGSDGWVEARPVKGTAPRGATWHEDQRLADRLRCSEKDRAENLMIADLLRNDLGMVCAPGTVHAPELMVVESFETVHQLVSTVRGRLRAGMRAPDCIRACFPAGSMTGAPKRRTMQIIDELEGHARGVYSGALGYLGLGGGCDLAVVIRTIVMDAGTASLGVGGAIVAQSDPDDEFREVLLKAVAPLAAIDPGIDVNTIDGVRDGALGEPVAAAL